MSEGLGNNWNEQGATVALSVCVCTFNRADDLAFLLKSLARLRVPQGRGVEFVIVDNASTDATPAVLSAAVANFPFPLRTVREAARGLGAARNCALRHARGEVLAWTDDDCVPAEDWLERVLDHFDANPALDMLAGRVELYDSSHYPITINTSLTSAVIDSARGDANIVNGCNMIFRRRLPERVGIFDPRFGAGAPLRSAEDNELAFRALRAGCRIEYAPDVLMFHNHKRVAHDEVMRLRRSYSYGTGALLMKHIVAGDSTATRGTAARWLYWQVRGDLGRIRRPPLWLTARRDNATVLWELIAGALAYLGFALRGSPAPAPGRAARSLGSAS